ncbi:uncharacterized protein LOC114300823 isoform X1 [Camellia sinensis]|uniref:uncharacterized protein LOC114300823 isoform X1 n=1 Tax=Camellia sinensis TaxID=4442 RepID=UPI0010358521|nr:uncharacterized protein LOC114300823 isoform X1 [Camellia sinensis]
MSAIFFDSQLINSISPVKKISLSFFLFLIEIILQCAPSTRKESVLMEANADMNMLKFFDHSPPLYLLPQFLTNFWFLIQFLVSFILYILYQELAWQSNSSTSGMDANFTLRACPICRKVSYFVIPSVIWYSTKEEKQEIVDSYKAKHREAGNTSFLTYSLLYGENYLGSWRNYLKLDFAPR